MDRLVFTKPDRKPERKIELPVRELPTLYEIQSTIKSFEEVPVPLRFLYKGIEIRILEVASVDLRGSKEYFVVVQLKYRDKLTRPFTIYCRDIVDFINKLRIELIRFRMFSFTLSDTVDSLTVQKTS